MLLLVVLVGLIYLRCSLAVCVFAVCVFCCGYVGVYVLWVNSVGLVISFIEAFDAFYELLWL